MPDPTPDAGLAATATLEGLGYTYVEGAARWKPPLGRRVDFGEIDRRRALAAAVEAGETLVLGAEDRARIVAALMEGRPRVEAGP